MNNFIFIKRAEETVDEKLKNVELRSATDLEDEKILEDTYKKLPLTAGALILGSTLAGLGGGNLVGNALKRSGKNQALIPSQVLGGTAGALLGLGEVLKFKLLPRLHTKLIKERHPAIARNMLKEKYLTKLLDDPNLSDVDKLKIIDKRDKAEETISRLRSLALL